MGTTTTAHVDASADGDAASSGIQETPQTFAAGEYAKVRAVALEMVRETVIVGPDIVEAAWALRAVPTRASALEWDAFCPIAESITYTERRAAPARFW